MNDFNTLSSQAATLRLLFFKSSC